MLGKELSKALREGRRVYGTCVTSTAPTWPAKRPLRIALLGALGGGAGRGRRDTGAALAKRKPLFNGK